MNPTAQKLLLGNHNTDGETPVYTAANNNYKSIVVLLLEHGASPNTATNEKHGSPGETPLMTCAEFGLLDIAIQLIAAGADVTLRDEEGSDALQYASAYGHLPIVKVILNENTAIVDRRIHYGYTAFQHAASFGNLDICQYLYDNYAININNENDGGSTPLMIAARKNKPKIVKYLLELNVDIGHKSHAGENALDYARQENNVEVIKLLENLY